MPSLNFAKGCKGSAKASSDKAPVVDQVESISTAPSVPMANGVYGGVKPDSKAVSKGTWVKPDTFEYEQHYYRFWTPRACASLVWHDKQSAGCM